MSFSQALTIPQGEADLMRGSHLDSHGWDHPHCTGSAEDAQTLIIQSIQESLPKSELNQVLLLNPGVGRLQEGLLQSIDHPSLKIDCLHEWFQDARLSSVNSNHRWSDKAYTWSSFLEIIQCYELIIVKISKSAQMNDLILKKLTSILSDHGKVWFWGANNEGMKSLSKKAVRLGYQAEVLALKKSCRVAELTWDEQATLQIEPSDTQSIQHWPCGALKSRVGCFGHGKVDQGTLLLMTTIEQELPNILSKFSLTQDRSSREESSVLRVLDLGCGSGVLSFFLEKLLPSPIGVEIIARDAHSLAIESLCMNGSPKTKILPSWGYLADNIPRDASGEEKSFDIVISNPPFHLSKKTLNHLGELWLDSLKEIMEPQSVLYLVANSFLDYQGMGEHYFRSVDVLNQRGGFCTYKMVP